MPSLNEGPLRQLPDVEFLHGTIREFLPLPAVVAEGPGGFLWGALLRAHGFSGTLTVLPYVNPRGWCDVAALASYRRFADRRDRVFLGSTPAAAVYQALGVETSVGEPYGIDDGLFTIRPGAARIRDQLRIPAGRVLLFAGRAQPDKDLYRLLRVSLKAQVLFSDLQIVIATHVVDRGYLDAARGLLRSSAGVHFVLDPAPEQLADLYNVADAFVTASTSHFETFGRAPAEALACGTAAVAPRYDGFAEVLAQPGGTLVDVEIDPATGELRADEERLLRGIFDVLSAPGQPPRHEVAATARRRFGRSTTLRELGYLAGRAPRPPRTPVRPARLRLPDAWCEPLEEAGRRLPPAALAWMWNDCDHDRLGGYDHAFTSQVRRSLCVPPPVDDGQEVTTCR
ncbi:glycosyltransferase family 4 protein [Geodermatophilus siccatus]|uniref:glycosyltransferase family 4 protein n=1 Tax=Geodermatophilus siccatus TaxID=1137991 RepID=UPI0011134E19|nr:glycosyltransferase family 4 protein [Geodermatophilus siccatus]